MSHFCKCAIALLFLFSLDDCFVSGDPDFYRGDLSISSSGRPCLNFILIVGKPICKYLWYNVNNSCLNRFTYYSPEPGCIVFENAVLRFSPCALPVCAGRLFLIVKYNDCMSNVVLGVSYKWV